jgi:splicing factor 3B subunit 1
MAEQRSVNERYEVYNKITRIKEESKRLSHEEHHKRKKMDDTITNASGAGENSETEFEKKEKAEAKAMEMAQASAQQNKIAGITPRRNRWDYAPGNADMLGKGAGGETPTPGRWVDPTPMRQGETPTPSRMGGKSKWDEPPTAGNATPSYSTQKDPNLMTPTPEISGERLQYLLLEKQIDEKNKPLTDEEINAILPTQGYEVSIIFSYLYIYR